MCSTIHHGMPILAFTDAAAFETWLDEHGRSAPGLWLKLAKKGAGERSVTKAEAVDAALCYGWIDGQLDRFDDFHWLTRFSPRQPRSKWSQNNRTRAVELLAEGRMRAAGLVQIEAAKADGRWDSAYASASTAEIPPDLAVAMAASPEAARFFATLSGANRFAILYRIGAVKKMETRARKIADFIAMLERGETVHG